MSSKDGGDDEGGGHNFAERADSLEQVRKKLRSGWRNDDKVLNQYFQSCFTNWKVYKGKRTPQQVLKLQAIYKQAVHGDNPDPPPERADTAEGLKWIAWRKLSGTPKEMAKRRFITFLAEIDPVLIDVMPDEKPPIWFPLDRKGIPICAKCNTKVGCLRPLLDQNKTNLKQQLFENELLQIPKKFAEWVRNALANQRCIWGVHKAISRAEAKPFTAWFEKDENRGFYPYDSISVMLLIHEFIHFHHEVTFEMMLNREEGDAQDYNAQVIKTWKLKEVYEQLAGEDFIFYVPCERDNDMCNQRRAADGGRNHTHPQELDPPTSTNLNTLAEAVELRLQCQKLGINPCTGVVVDIAQRCEIYRGRIAKHFEALQAAAEAKIRNEKRHVVHAAEKARVKELSKNMLAKQCWDICQMNLVDNVIQIVRRGCNPNEESPRGFTPLSTLVLNDAQIEKVEELLTLKANINMVNRFGFSPLMMACRQNSTKMVHILMRSGASALQKDDQIGRTALHWCVVHGCEEMVKIICEYLKEGAGDSMRVTRFLDSQTLDGETPLMLAARQRNGIMCYALTSSGANPNMRNNKGRTAAYLARQNNWSEIADWLEKKVGAGMAKVETFSDLQFEKQHRFGLIKIKDMLHHFGRAYLLLMQNRIGLHPLGCPFIAKSNVADRGEKAITEQRKFMDNHQLHVLRRDINDYLSGKSGMDADEEHQLMKEMRENVTQMLALLRAGMTNPNTELEPKPLAWTPLMCAVAVSDLRSIKLMIREGANPNHPNRDGTTPVMLAAQLQNVEALTELLIHKGDIEAVDTQGYSVASYATSLPLPTVMDRDTVGVLMDGDTDGPKPMTTMELIKLVLSGGLQDLKAIMTEREAAARPEALDTHFKVLLLLEKYGLSSVHTERNVHDSVRSAVWRVKEPDIFQHSVDAEKEEFERERRNKLEYLRLKKKAETQKTADEASLEDLRCPVCTLQVPCAHFFKVEILKQFLQKKIEAAKLAAAGELAAAAAAGGVKPRRKFISAKKLRIANRAQEILAEAHLADRNTDRSTLLIQQFRGREIAVAEEKERQQLMLQEALRLAEEEEALREDENDEEGEEGEPESAAVPMLMNQADSTPALLEDVAAIEEPQLLEGMEAGLPTIEESADEGEAEESRLKAGSPRGDNVTVQTSALPETKPAASKIRSVRRLPSKQDLAEVPEGPVEDPSVTASGAEVPAAHVQVSATDVSAELQLALVPVDGESADAVGELATDSTALVVVPEPADEEELTVAPSLKSALKAAITEVGGLSTALVEFKKKRRVKFYFSEESEDPPLLAITDGSTEGLAGLDGPVPMLPESALRLDNAFSDLSISEDSSISSGSTNSSTGDVQGSVLITAAPSPKTGNKPKTAGPGGIAMTDSAEFPQAPIDGVEATDLTVPAPDPFEDIETVSTSTTLTSADPSAAIAKPALTKSASDGLSSLQNGELPEYLKASSLVHPIPLHNRRVFLFTKNTMDRQGRTDGLVHIPPATPADPTQTAVTKKKKGKADKNAPRRFIPSEPIKVEVSGWIFVSLADIQSDINPLSSVSIALESWGGMLESVRAKMFDDWLPELRLEPVVSARTWQAQGPRCSVCSVGFVRFRSTIESFQQHPMAYIQLYGSQNISSSSDNTHYTRLCLACAVRQELFAQSKVYFPEGTVSEDQRTAWPFMHRKNVKESTLPQPTFSFISMPNVNSTSEQLAAVPSADARAVVTVPQSFDAGSVGSVSAMSWTTGLASGHMPTSQALVLLPPTTLQTAQSNSPVKSRRLQELDAREVWERAHHPQYTGTFLDHDDMSSIQSADSMLSGVTDSVEQRNRLGDEATISVASTVSAVDPAKKPKELALLPYLIAKGHYEEAERTLRIALGKRAVDEGEGLQVLIKLLTLQAEMYKSMGLWSLALAIYFDCVDMNASLMGFNDSATQASIVLLVSCLRKMQCVQLAGKYIKSLCRMVEQETMKSMKIEIIEKIKKQDGIHVKEFLGHNAIWTEMLKPHVVARNPLQRRFQSVVGMGGFYSLLTAQDGYSVVARISFYKFCEDADMKTLGVFARFIDFCFRLRLCDEPQIYKYLVQHVTQKQLAKSLISESEVARLYRTVTAKKHIDMVIDFLNFGVQPSVAVFDAMLQIALEKLLKVYRRFLLFEPAGSMLREQRVDIIAEAYDVSALIIQTAVRRRQAGRRVQAVRTAKHIEMEHHHEVLMVKKKRAARY